MMFHRSRYLCSTNGPILSASLYIRTGLDAITIGAISVSDPDKLNADPDPGFYLDADPDSGP